MEKQIMDQLRFLFGSIIQAKTKRVAVLDNNIAEEMRETIALLILTNSGAAILFSLSLFSIYKAIKKMQEKDKELSLLLKELNNSLSTREALLNSTSYAIISVDQNGLITSFNPAAEKMLGYQKEELIGKHTPVIFHDQGEIEARAIALSKQLKRKILLGFDVFVLLAKEKRGPIQMTGRIFERMVLVFLYRFL